MDETARTSTTDISPIFLHRWSPRAFDCSPITEEDALTILEAGRWAPSAFNYQPWRFLYARRGEPEFLQFTSLLLPYNQSWAAHASLMIVFLSDMNLSTPDKPSRTHSFDTGAAWAQVALQAHLLGYHAHAMAGIDFERTRLELQIPSNFHIEAAAAIGRKAAPASLPDALREKETPSDRKPLGDIAHQGAFPSLD